MTIADRNHTEHRLDDIELQHAIPFAALLATRTWHILDFSGAHTCSTRNACISALGHIQNAASSPETFLQNTSVFDPAELIGIEEGAEVGDPIKSWFRLLSRTILYLNKIVVEKFLKQNGEVVLSPTWLQNLRPQMSAFDICPSGIFRLFSECFSSSPQIIKRCSQDIEAIANTHDPGLLSRFFSETALLWPDNSWESMIPTARRFEFYRQTKLNEHALTLKDQADRLGQTLQKIRAAVNDTGPIYNAINQFGYIVPGSTSVTTTALAGLKSISYAQIRWGRLTDILGELPKDGELPLIMPDDIDTCLLAAYGGDTPEIPHFSLEPIGGDQNRHHKWRFDQKVFTPSWIGATELGRTFFFTDYLMKQISMANAYVSLTDPTYARPHDGRHSHSIPRWLDEEIADYSSGKDNDDPYLKQGFGGRLCWKLRSIEISRKWWRYYVGNAEVYVEGSSYRQLEDGTFERDYRLNDSKTDSGSTAKAMSENMERLCKTFPAVARLRELFKLIYLCHRLREDNVKLSWSLRRRIKKLKKRLPSSFPQAYVPKAYHRCGCSCDGGTDPRGAEVKHVAEDRLAAARSGTEYHSMFAGLLRDTPNNGFTEGSGFRLFGNNETMGGTKRPDAVYVNDERKIVVVEDVYTGTKFEVGHESAAHHLKGWNYMHEPKIQEMIESGYRYEYVCFNPKGTKH